jgi:hypothetical protein
MTAPAARQGGRAPGAGRSGNVRTPAAASNAADGDSGPEHAAGITHFQLGTRAWPLGISVDVVDVREFVEVAVRADHEEASWNAGAALGWRDACLLAAVSMDPSGQVRAASPAVVELELVDTVDREQLVAGRAAEPPGKRCDRHAGGRVWVIGGRRVVGKGPQGGNPFAGQAALHLGQQPGFRDRRASRAPRVEAPDDDGQAW